MRYSLCCFAALFLAMLSGCPPVRDGDDDDDDDDDSGGPEETDLETLWESLESGTCAVLPEGEVLLRTGASRATNGLWYDVACDWTGGNASSITVEVEYFDERDGGDYAATAVRPVEVGGERLSMEGDIGSLHVLPGDGEPWTLNGWWEGDLSGTSAAGEPVQLDAVLFKDAAIASVAGR